MPRMDVKHARHALFAAGAIGTLPLLFWADTGTGLVAGWRPFGSVEHAALLLMLVFSFLLLSLAAFGGVRRALALRGREWLLLVVLCGLAWALIELSADRIDRAFRPGTPFHTRGQNLRQLFHPLAEYLPGIQGPSHYTTGSDGIRAEAPPGPEAHTRVLCLGGSSTECVYLDDGKTWPARLMQQLNEGGQKVWVGNVGISGFDTRDHLRFLETSPLLQGVQGVVAQTGINDLWRFLAKEEGQTRYDRFSEGAETATAVARPPKLWMPLWTRSRVIQLYHDLRRSPPRPEFVEGPGGEEYRIRRERRAAAKIVDTPPDLSRGLEEYHARVGAMIAACRKRGLWIVFSTQPVLWGEDLPPDLAHRCWFGWLENGEYLALGALRAAMDRYNKTLQAACAAEGVPCVDLSGMNGRGEFFYDDCHFTEAGAAEAARCIAAAVTLRR